MENLEIYKLVEKIVNDAYTFAEAKELIYENEEKKNLRKLWSEYSDFIKKINKYDRLENLVPVLTDSCFKKMLPLIAIPATELCAGDYHRIEDITRLQKALEEDEMKYTWEKMSETFYKIMRSLDLTADSSIYSDVGAIVHILIEAFSYLENFDYTGQNKYNQIYQARIGKNSDTAPVFINTISVFRNMHDIVCALENSGLESLIMFAAVIKTYGDTNDYFEDWQHEDYFNERKRNTMRNENVTAEEYANLPDEWSRTVYLVVKNGENVWFIPSHFGDNTYSSLNSFFEYGKRKTYFPYQVFFKGFSAQPEKATLLATTNTSYKLNHILDEEQKVFTPILMYEAKRIFFDNVPPSMELVVIPQETKLLLSEINKSVPNALICAQNSRCDQIYTSSNYRPETLFNEAPEVIKMMQIMNISEKDIVDAPVLPTQEKLKQAEFEEKLIENIKKAYQAVIRKRLKAYRDILEETHEFYQMERNAFSSRKTILLERLTEGKFINYSSETIDKQIGSTCRYQNEYKGHIGPNRYGLTTSTFVLSPEGYLDESKKYPICIEVRPFTKKEIMDFYGWEDDSSLPFLIKYRDEIVAYYGSKKCLSPISNRDETPGILPISGMNVCMGKKFYNKHLSPLFDKKEFYDLTFLSKQSGQLEQMKDRLLEKGFSVNLYWTYKSDRRIIAEKNMFS